MKADKSTIFVVLPIAVKEALRERADSESRSMSNQAAVILAHALQPSGTTPATNGTRQ